MYYNYALGTTTRNMTPYFDSTFSFIRSTEVAVVTSRGLGVGSAEIAEEEIIQGPEAGLLDLMMFHDAEPSY